MSKLILFVAAVFGLSPIANAGDVMGDYGPIGVTSYATVSPFYSSEATSKSMKLVDEAHEDIYYFVASQGQVRTARFESALAWSKANLNTAGASDLEIAQELLGSFSAQ